MLFDALPVERNCSLGFLRSLKNLLCVARHVCTCARGGVKVCTGRADACDPFGSPTRDTNDAADRVRTSFVSVVGACCTLERLLWVGRRENERPREDDVRIAAVTEVGRACEMICAVTFDVERR